MPTSVRDAKDAALDAWMDIQTAMADFQRQWNAPDIQRVRGAVDQGALQQWDAIPPDAHVLLEQQNPQGYSRAKTQIEAIRKKRG